MRVKSVRVECENNRGIYRASLAVLVRQRERFNALTAQALILCFTTSEVKNGHSTGERFENQFGLMGGNWNSQDRSCKADTDISNTNPRHNYCQTNQLGQNQFETIQPLTI